MAHHDYDMIVIGGGAAGLTCAGIAASFGAKTLLIERDRLGGDCTWTGCIPSKTLLKTAEIAHHARHASRWGLPDLPPTIDFAQVAARLRRIRQEIYVDADRPERFEALGATVKRGRARFLDAHTIELVNGDRSERLTGRLFSIATGASASVPPIPGLEETPHLTNETIFERDELPTSLVVVGAGPVGTEMAQAFARLGSRVTVIDAAGEILSNDDTELAATLRGVLESEGVEYHLGASIEDVRPRAPALPSGDPDSVGAVLRLRTGSSLRAVEGDALLVATGRRANVRDLGLDAAGVEHDSDGIRVDDRCRTSRSHIHAVGDVTGRWQFTHMSEHMAKVAMTNAILRIPMRVDADHVPWVTYTDPELASVGSGRSALEDAGERFETYRFPYSRIDRAVTDGETTGMIKVFAKRWTGRILGATVLGARAGELIGELALAMRHGIPLRKVSDTIHPYPTYGLGVRRAADQWYARKHSVRLVKLLRFLFRYRGPVVEPDPDRIV